MADIKISQLQNYRPVTDGLIVPVSYSTGTRADGTLRYKSANITSEDLKIYVQSDLNITYATHDNVSNAITTALNGGGTESIFATKTDVKLTTDALDVRITTLENTTNEHLTNYCNALDAKVATLEGGLSAEITARTEGDEDTLAAAKEYTDAEVAKVNVNDRMTAAEASITKNTSDILKLNGNDTEEGSVKYIVAQKIAAVVDNAPESFDTLKELAAWINSNGATATGMQESIITNTNAIAQEIKDRTAADTALDNKLTQDIANAIADKAIKSEVETAISTALETAKGYTDTAVSDKATVKYVDETVAEEIGKINTNLTGNYVTTSAMQTYVEGLKHATASQVAEDIAAAKSELSAVDTQLSKDLKSLSDSLVDYAKVANVNAHINDGAIHVTTDDKTSWNATVELANTLNTNVANLKTSLENADTELSGRIDTLNQTITDNKSTCDERNNTLTNDIAGINAEITTIKGNITDANGLISTNKSNIETINTTIATIQSTIETNKKSCDDKDSALDTRIKAVEDASQTHALKTTVEALQEALDAAVERIAALEAKLAKYDTRFGWTDAVLTDNNAWTKSFLLVDSDDE